LTGRENIPAGGVDKQPRETRIFIALQLNFLFFLQEIELQKALIPFIGVSALLLNFRQKNKKFRRSFL
jgi:hypothetical protein